MQDVFDALNENQRRQAMVSWQPGEAPAGRIGPLPRRGQRIPGLAASDLTADQRRLWNRSCATMLSPYRREDADEVMQIIRRNGGLERIHLAFYRDGANRRTPLALLAPRRPRLRVELPRPAARAHVRQHRRPQA